MNRFKVDHAALADRFAPVMFCASLLFLGLVAALIVVWVDVPRFALMKDSFSGEDAPPIDPNDPLLATASHIGAFLIYGIAALWVLIVCEVLVQLFISVRTDETINVTRWRIFALLQCLCPPLRLAAPNIAKAGQIWLPRLGWQKPRRKLYKRLEAAFSKPMLFFALLILPLLLVEFGLRNLVEQFAWLRIAIHICTGLIWCAFAIEFIVLVSASERRLRYVKKNWLDLAIILLPIILFLRSLRAVRVVKLARFAKVQQLVRLSRVYQVRGVAMKLLRAVMLLEFFGRVVGGSPEKKLKRLQMDYHEKQEELDEIAQEMAKVERLIRERAEKNEGPTKP